jgi:plastocyanin
MVAGVMSARGAVLATLAVLTLGTAGCSSSASSGGAGHVTIKDFVFRPQHLTVKVGQTVTIANHDTSLHGFATDDHLVTVRSISPGLSNRVSFSKAGTFSYHCTFHASMTGVVTVKE